MCAWASTTYEARQAVIIAVGSQAAMPPIPGLAEAKPWTNREVTTAQSIPSRLAILGGSAVGVEMAQAYSSLGAKVALIEAEQRLLPREEPFAGEELRDALLERGVEIHLGAKAKAVHETIEVSPSPWTTVSASKPRRSSSRWGAIH